ncbi:MFS transporter [Bradyrhizobium sp.]|uniref:MFS transporter n=1 Tax=Bradyrhizobium sp. TaxID=376 RepID=UPI0025BA9755|nr:MFS transporter [Bradyrhizobium sp.]
MTIDRSTATAAAAAPVDLSPSERHGIFLYLGILIILLAFGGPSGGLIDIPISFFLKNRLHLTAHEVATFRLVAAIPLYLSFVFGFIRDMWNPLGMRDRGFMLSFGGITALLYVLCAFTPMTYATLLAAIVLLTASFLFVSSAQNGLTSVIGQQHAMTGQVSAVWNVFLSIPTVGALLIGGKLSGLLEEKDPDQALRILFLVGAAIMTLIALYALWKPAEVFDNIRVDHGTGRHPIEDMKRLVRHWPIYPAMLIWLLWNFAPGSTTPLQYHLQNSLHATDAQWGGWNAIFAASFIPTYIVYGLLCRKFPLKTLLVWGTVLAVPQMVPLLFIDTMTEALIAAVPIGLMGGLATGAYLDLIIRSCPRGMQGTTLMMSWSLYFVVSRFGDVLGTYLYDRYGGFTVCVIAITIVYALIFPSLLLVPKRLIATADGQAPDFAFGAPESESDAVK